jgi:hypothetical protein
MLIGPRLRPIKLKVALVHSFGAKTLKNVKTLSVHPVQIRLQRANVKNFSMKNVRRKSKSDLLFLFCPKLDAQFQQPQQQQQLNIREQR